ncbi:hypothetical protein ACFQ4C_07550 [Larkinella insperata]|uniref:Uncharacterized protein n=1 Tax=Larkinella insperata TaxID=332158 RepID=A0ABW3Q256_9BACT
MSLLLISAQSILSCSNQKEKVETVYYVIGSEKPPVVIDPVITDPNEPPPPPAPFYGSFNLILVDHSLVYVHRVDDRVSCELPNTPEHVDLTQTDVRKVDLENLSEFLKSAYRDLNPTNFREYFTCIKSPSDTITNAAFPVIQQFFQDRKFKAYIIRQWTPQEQQVITSMR